MGKYAKNGFPLKVQSLLDMPQFAGNALKGLRVAQDEESLEVFSPEEQVNQSPTWDSVVKAGGAVGVDCNHTSIALAQASGAKSILVSPGKAIKITSIPLGAVGSTINIPTEVPHGLVNGQVVAIEFTDSVPVLEGLFPVSNVSASAFDITLKAGGTGIATVGTRGYVTYVLDEPLSLGANEGIIIEGMNRGNCYWTNSAGPMLPGAIPFLGVAIRHMRIVPFTARSFAEDIYGVSDFSISNCQYGFRDSGNHVLVSNYFIKSLDTSPNNRITVTKNSFLGGVTTDLMDFKGVTDLVIQDNYYNGLEAGSHAIVVADCERVRILANQVFKTLVGFCKISDSISVDILDNFVKSDSIANTNICVELIRLVSVSISGLNAQHYTVGIQVEDCIDIRITSNIIGDSSAGTQIGIWVKSGPNSPDRYVINNNVISNFPTNSIKLDASIGSGIVAGNKITEAILDNTAGGALVVNNQ